MIITGMLHERPVIFLHGFGSSASAFQKEWEIAGWKGDGNFLNGIERDKFSKAYRWFPFSMNEGKLTDYILRATDIVENEIVKQEPGLISIAGHSQGAMIALELLLRNNILIKDLWSFSGFLPRSLLRPFSNYNSPNPNVHLCYSEADQYISKESFENTCKFFRSAKHVNTTINISQKLDHNFSREWLFRKNYLRYI